MCVKMDTVIKMIEQKPLSGTNIYEAHIISIDSFPLHRHYEAEILFCLEGEIKSVIDGETVILSENEVLFIGSFVPHSYETEKPSPVVLTEFGYALLKEEFSRFSLIKERYKKYTLPSQEVYSRMVKLRELLENEEKAEKLDVISEIFGLAAALVRDMNIAVSQQKKSEMDRIAPALRLIHINYFLPLGIDDACRETSLSPGNFCTLFKKVTGTGFHSYLNSYRVENAACLLSQTELSVNEICTLSGFSDIKTFYRVFGKHKGCPPVEFRKKSTDGSIIRENT